MIYTALFYFTTGTTLLSGGLGFLMKLPVRFARLAAARAGGAPRPARFQCARLKRAPTAPPPSRTNPRQQAFYKPDAYLIGPRGSLAPGRGDTPFEELSTFVFGTMYVGPLVGMAYAHLEGSTAAKRAACLMPLVYHVASVVGVLRVFPAALNPAVASLPAAAAMHAVYAGLFAALFFAAADAKGKVA